MKGFPGWGFHPDNLSILFAASTNGVLNLLRISTASSVWGWNPSLISTTSTARSASAPPLARRVVNALCPGVSMKSNPGTFVSPLNTFPQTLLTTSSGTSVAPICCVIRPASRSAIVVPLILSSSEVLPWSTCPITHTIGVRRF
ncbi:Uncharacterised protein [uncultured archaeon]|nr:Uncharacterised protein [uncultured archaeon]